MVPGGKKGPVDWLVFGVELRVDFRDLWPVHDAGIARRIHMAKWSDRMVLRATAGWYPNWLDIGRAFDAARNEHTFTGCVT